MKMMFTKLRCSVEYRGQEKKFKKFMMIAEAKGWLIDLNMWNELSSYLLEDCVILSKDRSVSRANSVFRGSAVKGSVMRSSAARGSFSRESSSFLN